MLQPGVIGTIATTAKRDRHRNIGGTQLLDVGAHDRRAAIGPADDRNAPGIDARIRGQRLERHQRVDDGRIAVFENGGIAIGRHVVDPRAQAVGVEDGMLPAVKQLGPPEPAPRRYPASINALRS